MFGFLKAVLLPDADQKIKNSSSQCRSMTFARDKMNHN